MPQLFYKYVYLETGGYESQPSITISGEVNLSAFGELEELEESEKLKDDGRNRYAFSLDPDRISPVSDLNGKKYDFAFLSVTEAGGCEVRSLTPSLPEPLLGRGKDVHLLVLYLKGGSSQPQKMGRHGSNIDAIIPVTTTTVEGVTDMDEQWYDGDFFSVTPRMPGVDPVALARKIQDSGFLDTDSVASVTANDIGATYTLDTWIERHIEPGLLKHVTTVPSVGPNDSNTLITPQGSYFRAVAKYKFK